MADSSVHLKQEYYQTAGHALAAAIVLGLVDIIAVASRLHGRRQHKQKLMMDDWLILPALVFTVGIAVIIVFGVSREAFGSPTKIPPDYEGNLLELKTDQLSTSMTLQYTYSTVIVAALGCTKASFLCFYRRIFAVNKSSRTNIVLLTMLGFVALWTVAFCLTCVFQCRLNFWAIRGSSMDLETQSSALRLATMVKTYIVGFAEDEDPSSYLYWGMVECGVAVFAACLPTLQFLLRALPWETLTTSIRGLFSRNSNSADRSVPGVRLDKTTVVESIRMKEGRDLQKSSIRSKTSEDGILHSSSSYV
ncbi:unnamed protein product [Clonostachys solani]|uniref:Rhodopsin domain-containing protein n=1 Tax=Clonostachys solani TaxID=160281 RepID=A0A9N9W763_9HYPO|nr:unnamed protein product [Clonostachys solani]